jgi:hypothetical protein
MEAHFPGSSKVERKFKLELIELLPEATTPILSGVTATAYTVVHPRPNMSMGTVFGPSVRLRLITS